MHIINTLLVRADVVVPEISPRFDAPFFEAFQRIASYVLGGALILVLIALIVAIAALAFRGLAPERARTWAGENIVWIFIAAAALGAVSGLFQWFISFDFGF